MQYSESRSRGGRKCHSLESLSILASAVTMKIGEKGFTQNLVEITLDLPKLSTETGIRRTTSDSINFTPRIYLPLPGEENILEMTNTVKPTSIPGVLLCCTKRLSIDPLLQK